MTKNNILEKLENGVKELFSSERYQEWLAVQTRFHNYSAGNSILIYLQNKNATRVAGFQAWKALGRHVRKGEKAMQIMAPLVSKDKDDNVVLRGFKTVSVFDVSQTEGPDLPILAERLTGEDHADALEKLKECAQNQGLIIVPDRSDAKSGRNGYYAPTRKEIGLRETLATDHKVKTLLHELAHYHTWTPDQDEKEGELLAESVAYIVCQRLGLDSGTYSFGYVASWAGSEDGTARLRGLANTIQKTAETLAGAVL